MAGRIISVEEYWNSQPQYPVAVAPKFADQAGFIFDFSKTAGAVRNLVGDKSELAAVANAVAVNRAGFGAKCNSNTRSYYKAGWNPCVTSDGNGTGDFTLLVASSPAAGTTNVGAVLNLRNNQIGYQSLIARANRYYTDGDASGASTTQSGTMWFGTFSDTSTATPGAYGISHTGILDGQPHVWIYRRRGTTMSLWCDGVHIQTKTGITKADLTAGTYLFSINGWPSADNIITDGITSLVGEWNYGFEDDLAREVSGNPQQIFYKEPQIFPVYTGGGISTDLIIADASHAHAVDVLSLSTDAFLAIVGSTHAHAADAFVLTSDHLLAVADATHAHGADSVVLTTDSALVIAASDHAHSADALALSTDTLLAVADSGHAHGADVLDLTAQSVLAVADSTHAHASDTLTLSADGSENLAIPDTAHAHSADALVLTSEHLLAVAGVSHAHLADSLTLSDSPSLAVADASHAHAVDAPALTLDSTLGIAGVLHGHLAGNVVLTYAATLGIMGSLHAHLADSITFTFTIPDATLAWPDPSGAGLDWPAGSGALSWPAPSGGGLSW